MINSIELTVKFDKRTKKTKEDVLDILDFSCKKQFGAELLKGASKGIDGVKFTIVFSKKENIPKFTLGKWTTMKRDDFFRNKHIVDANVGNDDELESEVDLSGCLGPCGNDE